MTDQQAQKLAREVCEFVEQFDDQENYPTAFPLLRWLYNAIIMEGTLAEKVHMCPVCSKNKPSHKGHQSSYKDVDGKIWLCHCPKCEEK
jgi:hypothetical protein